MKGWRYSAHMGKLRNALGNERLVGGILAVGLMTGIGAGVVAIATSANAEQPAVVQTEAPALTFDLTGTDENGLAAEQEAEAAAAEQARIAAEAEAARIAAEQAAAAEAARIAAEQAAAEAEPEIPSDPAPEAPTSYCPPGYIDDPNRGCHSPICAVLEDGTQVPCE